MPLVHRQPRSLSFRLSPLVFAAPLVFLCASVLNAQSPDQVQAPPAPSSAYKTPTADSSSKSASPAKPKHVITNEDLEPDSTNNSNSDETKLPGEDALLLQCNTTCETEARNYLGYDSDNEAEWRLQIVKARPELAEDTVWRGMLSQAIQQSNTYCNLLLQQSQTTAPSGDDYRSQVQRSKNAQYFDNMERTLHQGIQATMNRMQDRIKDVEVLSPVRAAMMYVQGTRIFERTCDPSGAR